MFPFSKSVTRLIILVVACQVTISALLVSPIDSSHKCKLSCIHCDSFGGTEFLTVQEEKEVEESISSTADAQLLNLREHNFNLNRSHSHCRFQSVESISSRFTLFCALLI
jgi:hypothetical protein